MNQAQHGHLADNILHFARVLRSAGIPLASERIVMATEAVMAVGIGSLEDLRYSLCCTLITSADQQNLFDQAFTAFWRDPDLLGKAMQMLLPKVDGGVASPHEANRRLAEALATPARPRGAKDQDDEEKQSIEASLSFSNRELLQKADFETLSAAEWVAVTRLIAQMLPQMPLVLSRRKKLPYIEGRLICGGWHAMHCVAAARSCNCHVERAANKPCVLSRCSISQGR